MHNFARNTSWQTSRSRPRDVRIMPRAGCYGKRVQGMEGAESNHGHVQVLVEKR